MQRGSSHSVLEGLTLQVMVLVGPLETIGSNAHSKHRKGAQMDLFKLVQLDGAQIRPGPWLLSSLSSSVVLFVLIVCNGLIALLEVGLVWSLHCPSSLQEETVGHWGFYCWPGAEGPECFVDTAHPWKWLACKNEPWWGCNTHRFFCISPFSFKQTSHQADF